MSLPTAGPPRFGLVAPPVKGRQMKPRRIHNDDRSAASAAGLLLRPRLNRRMDCLSLIARGSRRILFGLLVVLKLGGCASTTRLTELESENRALSAQTRAQTTEIENLRAHSRRVVDELARTEASLAQMETAAERQQLLVAAYQRERELVHQQLAGWTPTDQPPPPSPRALSQLDALSQRVSAVRFDRATAVGKLETDVMFDSGKTELKAGAVQSLRNLDRALQSPELSDLRVVVVGHTDSRPVAGRPLRDELPTNLHLSAARSLAVADCLREAGLSEDRLSIVGFGAQWPAGSDLPPPGDPRQSARRVEVCVVAADVPLVGRVPPPGSMRR